MKKTRIVTLTALTLCALFLPILAQAQTWTYAGVSRDDLSFVNAKIKITITKRPNGYQVSGQYTEPSRPPCAISGTYYPNTGRLAARTKCDGFIRPPVDGLIRKGRGNQLEITRPLFFSAFLEGPRPKQDLGDLIGKSGPASGGPITVVSGTYGGNCKQPESNKTPHLAKACNGKSNCQYVIDYKVIGDPAPGCAKNYIAKWRCGSDPKVRSAEVSPEAGRGKTVILSCEQ